jgi:hypothetical protein
VPPWHTAQLSTDSGAGDSPLCVLCDLGVCRDALRHRAAVQDAAKEAIPSLPGQHRWGVARLREALEAPVAAGLRAVLVFGVVSVRGGSLFQLCVCPCCVSVCCVSLLCVCVCVCVAAYSCVSVNQSLSRCICLCRCL